MIEIWKDIDNCEGIYQVSNTGKIKILQRWVSTPHGGGYYQEERLKSTNIVGGYEQVALMINKKSVHLKVHRIVAKAFIPNPYNKLTVNHLDGNKLNNHVDNLEWATQSEQLIHAHKHKLKIPHYGRFHQNSKPVLNTFTGIFYESAEEAFRSQSAFKRCNFSAKMAGRNKNNTPFIYI